jgi:hypothetical protein
MDSDKVHEEAVRLLQTKSDDEIFVHIAEHAPREVADFILRIDQLSRRQLTTNDLKYLQPPLDLVRKEVIGKTVFDSLKRVLWRSLCDPESDVYKAWFRAGMGVVLNRGYIAVAVTAALSGSSLGYKALAVSATALLMKIGIEMFCDRFHPGSIMEAR